MANRVEIEIAVTNARAAIAQLAGVGGELGRLGTTIGTLSRIGATIAPVVGVLGALGTAVIGAGKSIADTTEKLDRMSRRTGVSIETLQVMREVIDDAGGNAESLTTALTFLNRAIATQDPLLKQLGITTKDTATAFAQLVDVLSRSGDTSKVTEIAFQLLGRGSSDLIADFKALATEIPRMRAEMEKAGSLIKGDTLPAARELDAELDKLGRNFKGFWTQSAQAAVPAAALIVRSINDVITASRNMGRSFARAPGGLGFFGAFAGAGAAFAPHATPASAPGAAGGDPLANVTLGKATEVARTIKQILADMQAWIRLESSFVQNLGQTETRGPGGLATLLRTDEPVPVPDLRIDERTQVLEAWRDTVKELTDSARVLDGVLGAAFDGLSFGFASVFANLRTQAITFKSFIEATFGSMVDAVLAELGRLAAAKLFGFLLNLILPGVGSAVAGGAVSAVAGTPGLGGNLPGTRARQGGDTYNIHTFNARDAIQQIQSGELRRANNVVRFQGAY